MGQILKGANEGDVSPGPRFSAHQARNEAGNPLNVKLQDLPQDRLQDQRPEMMGSGVVCKTPSDPLDLHL